MPLGRSVTLSLLAAVRAAWPRPAAAAQARPAAAAPLSDLASLDARLGELSRRVAPSVVQVLASGYTTAPNALLARAGSSGSGVIVDAEGWIVTNAHVVESARSVRVDLVQPAPAGRLDPAAAQPAAPRARGGARPGDGRGRAEDRAGGAARPRDRRLRGAPPGAGRDGLRQPAGPRELGEPGCRERGRAAAEAGRPDDLRADRRLHQPRQQRRAARGRRGADGGAQHDDPLAVGRERGHRPRRPEQHRARGLRADPPLRAGAPRRHRRARADDHPAARRPASGSSSTAASCSRTCCRRARRRPPACGRATS